MTTELTLIDRARAVMVSDRTEAELIALAGKYLDVTEIKDETDAQMVGKAIADLVRHRRQVEKAGKAGREDAAAYQKAVIAEEKRLCSITEPEERRLKGLKEEWDAEQTRIAREEHEREMARQEGIRKKIEALGAMVREATGQQAAKIAGLVEALDNLELSADDFEEYLPTAMTALNDARLAARGLLAQTQEREQQEAQARARAAEEALRLEQQRQQQAQEAARLAQEAARLAQERAEIARQRREAEAVQARIEAEKHRQEAEQEQARLMERAALLRREESEPEPSARKQKP